MEIIKDYLVTGKISEIPNAWIYRGHKIGDTELALINVLDKQNLSSLSVEIFKREYKKIKQLDYDTILKVRDILENDNKLFLITEDFNGIPITDYFQNRFDLTSFLRISIQLAEALGDLHKNDITHKNLRPGSILVKKGNVIKISHFDVWAELTGEKVEFNGHRFAYISPEQTGRIESAIDYRTDFYSLGVLLYEIITGTVPFKSSDPMEVIHAHIAVVPHSPISLNSGIPEAVSNIVMKLLAKSADERYQSSFGLILDLEKCLSQYENQECIETFTIAENDVSIKFQAPQKLFGREEEFATLKRTFDKTVKGSAEILFIKGRAGVGKTSLIKEIQNDVVINNGYFIFGKYEKNHRDMPYSAIIQAFKSLIKQILSEPNDIIEILKARLLSELGENCRLIADMIPEITLIIGKQPELTPLPPLETMNRFYFVCEKFTEILAQQRHPVVLFLDDIQWADSSSLKLLHKLTTRPGVKYFCLFCAFRENEITYEHPINIAIRSIESTKQSVNTLTLEPLEKSDLKELIEHFLKHSHAEISLLSDVVYKKTGGNPFYIIELLRTLYNEKIIGLNNSGNWQWDIDKVSAVNVTDNVVELLIGNVKKLSETLQNMLKFCACVSGFFDLEFLSLMLDQPIDITIRDLKKAMSEGIISQLKEKKSGNNIYHYHHDHIEEAVYSLLSEIEKAKYHYRIGRYALENRMENDSQNKLFYIVDQLNSGQKCIVNKKEKRELSLLNLKAGRKAKTSVANFQAEKYFQAGTCSRSDRR